jgi:hypothetical protein
LDPRTHLDVTHFNRLNWLPVQKRVDSITLSHVFKVKHNIAPEYLKEHFIPADSVHSYSTRFRETGCYSIPKVKGFGMKSFSYNGCKLWNTLPTSVKNINKLADFKLAVRKQLYTEF